MKLMWEAEYWRDELTDTIDKYEGEADVTLDDGVYNDIAKELRSRVVMHLFDDGIDASWSYQQSVGAGVLIQSATPDERAAFDAAMEAEREWFTQEVKAEVQAYVRDMQEVSDE